MMQVLRKFLIAASVLVALPLLYFSGLFLPALSVSTYPLGALALVPWMFGVAGVVGLLLSWTDATAQSALRLRIDATLLCMGSVAALIFAALLLYFLRYALVDASARTVLLTLLAVAVFPVMPLALAGVELRRLRILMRATPLAQRVQLRRFHALLFGGCVVLVLVRVLVQEAIMLRYGADLVANAYASAEAISGNAPYCVIDWQGADTFEELDTRQLLLAAITKRWGLRGMNPTPKDPHFGIFVNGKFYWWSFRQREFVELPLVAPVPWRVRPESCR